MVEPGGGHSGAGLDGWSPSHTPLLAPASTSGPHFPLRLDGEGGLGTRRTWTALPGNRNGSGPPHPVERGPRWTACGSLSHESRVRGPRSSLRCQTSEFEGQGRTWA